MLRHRLYPDFLSFGRGKPAVWSDMEWSLTLNINAHGQVTSVDALATRFGGTEDALFGLVSREVAPFDDLTVIAGELLVDSAERCSRQLSLWE